MDLFMKSSIIAKRYSILVLLIVSCMITHTAYAQLQEPDVVELPQPKTPLSEGFHNSLGFDVMVNNFGFGIGGSYGRVIGPYTQLTFQTGITGIRDASEQNFQSFITGRQVVPNKYKRAFGFPILIGLKQRIFAKQVDDNLRFFVSGAAGPAMAFTYPYVQDRDNSGFRTFQQIRGPNGQVLGLSPSEQINDFFSGWSNGETHWGFNGAITIGADIGSKFNSQTTVEFGYFFYYFKGGLQIMEPRKPTAYNQNTGLPVSSTEFFDAQSYFGTPQIKLTFGGMW
jgi:hypothetical protein